MVVLAAMTAVNMVVIGFFVCCYCCCYRRVEGEECVDDIDGYRQQERGVVDGTSQTYPLLDEEFGQDPDPYWHHGQQHRFHR